jgi:hypothetical protein
MTDESGVEIERETIPHTVAEYVTPKILAGLTGELARDPTGPVFAVLLRDQIALAIKLGFDIEVTRTAKKCLRRPSKN